MGIEWPLTLFTIVAGSGAGILAFAGVSEFFGASKKARFIAAILSLILLVVGGCLSLLHLGNPVNFMAAATNLFSFSPISMELIFLGLGVIIAIIYLVLVNRESTASKALGVCGIIVGVIFCYASGHGYEVIDARPAWASPMTTFSYMLSALTIGGFLFLCLQVAFKDESASIKKVGFVVLIAAVLETIVYIAYGALSPIGENALLFWIGAVIVGGVIAAVAGLLVYLKNNVTMIYVGIIAALVGGIAFRAVMWLSGSLEIADFFDIAANSRGLFPF
ncbi:MAG: dimethyl sulfoxide reductase anchor subunit [Coriobacteriales bacterium]|jgi:anaerobic dimethyl sulfoxide reductase subunit C (anchor subunit)|nr:dimethyl sulfoxide reductase anchor subunit [Coriobacteriales bacterium]